MDNLDLYDNLKNLHNGVCAIQSIGYALEINETDGEALGKGLSYITEHVERALCGLLEELKEELNK